ncbi:MAG: L-serine ammonia-lyase [Ectothiorhodospiraceae bacterium]|jgi:L-serine dehydratase
MAISLFEMFKIGIGPSSSHTVGPMLAAAMFCEGLESSGRLASTTRVRAQLYGSLAATGRGHGSDKAVLMGLEGHHPDRIEPEIIGPRVREIEDSGRIRILDRHEITFDGDSDLVFQKRESLPYHPNGLVFTAWDAEGEVLAERQYYSVGGGFVLDEDAANGESPLKEDDTPVPYPFSSGAELLEHAERTGLPFSELMLANEAAFRSEDETRAGILRIWNVMQECVNNGLAHTGELPGGLRVRRRAAALFEKLQERQVDPITPALGAMDWVNLYALAVNEENAAGGRIVTAPTNGAAGIVPAVLHYYRDFCPNATEEGITRFLLTAGAIGIIIKLNASISGAEVGCQGEVGSACAMAAAGLAEACGATPRQVENAAEIALEHHLGMTCDPIGGLVQIPCIERNAMASVKAINAASMAMRGDGEHFVSLDKVVRTMRDTGKDMLDKYKETSRGGLAVNVIEC